ncbi:riboflavin synthase [Foetidibacter luteolus]|uniref:riboflavin synthase n=1 Tax=Foetidibacter luteolus TaxID=2608880 RepID=UPI00129A792A|nr:riboflavin synthase [Foetidibacter luteolus]
MFTGIIECTGTIQSITANGTNRTFVIASPISAELKVDQSVSHSGVCLTVEEVNDGTHSLTAIEETLKKTNLGNWQTGGLVNMERCLAMNGRLDGHIVQGHVDATAVCTGKENKNGSWEFSFRFNEEFAALVIEKGSIAVNGISLTVFNVGVNEFSVAIIPYTYNHTNISSVETGDTVNIEFDMVGKYIQRLHQLNQRADQAQTANFDSGKI